jgi:hypothetical protein
MENKILLIPLRWENKKVQKKIKTKNKLKILKQA